jgi:hypothetical protein
MFYVTPFLSIEVKMNKIKISLILIVFVLVSCNEDELKYKKVFLPKGKTPGTFSFKFTSEVKWALESGFPVEVSIINCKTKEEFEKLMIENEKPFSFSADLKPDCYTLVSHLLRNETKKDYKDFESDQIIIESDGSVFTGDIEIEHKRIFEIEHPSILNTIDLSKEQPKLKWKAVKDADYYSLKIEIYGYIGNKQSDRIETIVIDRVANFQYTFHIKKPQKKYDEYSILWTIKAFSKSKKLIAEEWGSFNVSF